MLTKFEQIKAQALGELLFNAYEYNSEDSAVYCLARDVCIAMQTTNEFSQAVYAAGDFGTIGTLDDCIKTLLIELETGAIDGVEPNEESIAFANEYRNQIATATE